MSSPNQSIAYLKTHLDADLAAELEREGDLSAGVRARLAADLRSRLAAYAAYIPARLVRAQLLRPEPGRTGGAFWQGSLLFADLSGFTALSERLSVLGRQGAEEVSAVVNRLFAALVAEIQYHQGALLKFGGDAITAFFDTDELGETHAHAATAAALAMQRRMAAFAGLETRAGTFTLQLRVGVHSGRVFAAEVGDSSHIELVVTGPEVNRVALAQEIAAPGEVVVSEQTAALLAGADLTPREGGFLLARDLVRVSLPPNPPDLIADGPDDLAALELLAAQLAALRPYLVRDLPRRFLEQSDAGLGEFRPVTVLFANFYDFSACLEPLHDAPELAAAVLNAYYRRAQAVVHQYDGIVNKVDMYTHGDKLMALFGAPTAHEDDPIRAVRCALELAQALEEANRELQDLFGDWRLGDSRLETPSNSLLDDSTAPVSNLQSPTSTLHLSQKIGINTGTVFAGRVGGATRYEYTVMGPAVNLAARLMSAATDGEVLLSPSVRASMAGQFVLEEGAPLRLKGLAEPVIPARVLRATGMPRGKEAFGEVNLRVAPLVGRDAELAALFAGGQAALAGQGRVLSVIGEAGAGKSRINEELIQRLARASIGPNSSVPPFDLYLGECQSYEQRTPYAALRGPLRDLLGLSVQSGPPDISALEARVAHIAGDLLRFTPLLGDALGISLGETALTAALSPQQRHDRLQELIIALFRNVARHEPLLITIEDLHWADSASLELLAGLAASVDDLALLLLLNYRPDPPIPAPWDENPTTVRVRLGELQPSDSAMLLGALLGADPPPAILPLLERTQGNPFFIEELVRALVSARLLVQDDAGGWRIAQPIDQVELPKSIEGLLIARLDRLDEPRQELLQVASVIGRRFQRLIVESVYASAAPLSESLERLVANELIQAELFDRNLAYIFRHALLRDVAYAGILYARRRVLHGRVARRIEEQSKADLEPHLPLLAWHYLQAEEWLPALRYHLQAARQASSRFANTDALALYQTALGIAERLAVSADPAWLVEQVAAIHEQSGEIHLLLAQYEDAERHFRESLALASAGAGPVSERWLRLHRLLATVEERRSRYEAAFAWLRPGMVRATAELRAEMARCYILGAGISYRQGEYGPAMEWARMGLSLAEGSDDAADQARALKLIGNIHREQGELAQAIEMLDRARSLFAELNVVGGLYDVLNDLGMAYTRAGRWRETVASFEQSLAISENIGDVLATARTANNLAVVLVGRNQLERAGQLYKLSSENFARIGSPLGVAVTTQNRGEVLLYQDRPAEAAELLDEAIAGYERINARNFLPEALRLAAEAALARSDGSAAHQFAARSLAVAAELGMAAEEAAARRALGQVALAAGDLAAAHDQLEQSRAALAQLDSRYDLGKTRYQQARLACATGDQATFAAARTDAIQIFADLDAQRDLDLARGL